LKILQIISKVRLRQTSKKNQVQLVDKYDVFLHKKTLPYTVLDIY